MLFLRRAAQKSAYCKILGQGLVFTTCVERMQNQSASVFFGISRTSYNTNHRSAAVATAPSHADHKRWQLEGDYQKHPSKSAALLEVPLEVTGKFSS